MESDEIIIWAHCNPCKHLTKHQLLFRFNHVENYSDDSGWDTQYIRTYATIRCKGCEEVSFQISYEHSDHDLEIDLELYPPRISRHPPVWMKKLPSNWSRLLREVYSALQTDSKTLAMMGARTLIDIYLSDKIGSDGGFAERINRLVDAGYLGTRDGKTLSSALEAGNAAAHRGFTPNAEDLNHAMDIVESLLQRHVLEKSAVRLEEVTPPRPPKLPKQPKTAGTATSNKRTRKNQ